MVEVPPWSKIIGCVYWISIFRKSMEWLCTFKYSFTLMRFQVISVMDKFFKYRVLRICFSSLWLHKNSFFEWSQWTENTLSEITVVRISLISLSNKSKFRFVCLFSFQFVWIHWKWLFLFHHSTGSESGSVRRWCGAIIIIIVSANIFHFL